MGGVAAVVSKTAAAPIERVKLLIQVRPQEFNGGIIDTFGLSPFGLKREYTLLTNSQMK